MKLIPLSLLAVFMLSSCAGSRIYPKVSGVVYESLTAKENIAASEIPTDASIIVFYSINGDGFVDVQVKNNTDQLMIIDRTQSFFSNKGHVAETYYDPTVRTETTSVTQGTERGASVNLGALASAAGVGGAVGTALSGVTVGGSNSNAVTNTNTTYYVDQPRLSIPPHGVASMGRMFPIYGMGSEQILASYTIREGGLREERILSPVIETENTCSSLDQSFAGCNICIAYSLDDGQHFETVLNDIYCNYFCAMPVNQNGHANDAIRAILQKKPDALFESWYRLVIVNNVKKYVFNPATKRFDSVVTVGSFGNGGLSIATYR